MVLKKILKEKGIKGLALSRETGIANNIICNICNGRIYPYPGWRKKISKALGIPEEKIFPECFEKDGEMQ